MQRKNRFDTYDKVREEVERDSKVGLGELFLCVVVGVFAVFGVMAVLSLVAHGVID